MNSIWMCSVEDYLEIMDKAIVLGKERGKKEGDDLVPEFMEVAKQLGKIPKCLGITEQDKDMVLGNLRDESSGKIKILDLTDEENNENPN